MPESKLPSGPKVREEDIEWTAIRSSGPGGQNVNKVATAIQLRFDIGASSLPQAIKQRLLDLSDKRVTTDGEIVLKAQRFRTQEKNRIDAIERLQSIVDEASYVPKNRVATKPGRAAKKRRVDEKTHRGKIKSQRGKPDLE